MTEAEIAVVGAGPAGLSAALYAARFLRSTLVLHDGSPRAARIPRTRNVPGFEAGVAGAQLITKMSRHATRYGAKLVAARIWRVERTAGGGFELLSENGRSWSARAVILATGLEHNHIPMDPRCHELASQQGILRYCPVCDGYEHRGKRIGVVGCDVSGAGEALFLRRYSPDVTLLTQCSAELGEQQRRDLAAAGIRTITDPIAGYELARGGIRVRLEGNDAALAFDVLYPALGSRPRSTLVASLGIPLDPDGNAAADSPFGTPVAGVYCAGDLVAGLDQISVALGHGAVAATRAHHWLSEREGRTADAVLDSAQRSA